MVLCVKACHGRWCGPGPAGAIRTMSWAEPGPAESFENEIDRAGPGREILKFDKPGRGKNFGKLMGRAGPRPTRCGLCVGRFAQRNRRSTCFHRSVKAAAHDAHETAHEILAGAAHDMWCDVKYNTAVIAINLPSACGWLRMWGMSQLEKGDKTRVEIEAKLFSHRASLPPRNNNCYYYC